MQRSDARETLLPLAYRRCVEDGLKPSVRNVGEAYRKLTGHPIWLEHVRVWLKDRDTLSAVDTDTAGDTVKRPEPIRNSLTKRPLTDTVDAFGAIQLPIQAIQSDAIHPSRAENIVPTIVLVQDNVGSQDNLMARSSKLVDKSTRSPRVPAREPIAKQPLLFDAARRAIEDRARQILALVWAQVEPSIGRSITKGEWGKRNVRVARDLATLGRTDPEIRAAMLRVMARVGVPRTLAIVQDELLRAAASKPARKVYTPTEDELR